MSVHPKFTTIDLPPSLFQIITFGYMLQIMDENCDEPTILFTMGSGSLIGEVDAFCPRLRNQGVKTRLECDVLKLSNAAVTEIISKHRGAMEKVMAIIMVSSPACRISKHFSKISFPPRDVRHLEILSMPSRRKHTRRRGKPRLLQLLIETRVGPVQLWLHSKDNHRMLKCKLSFRKRCRILLY